MKKLLFTLLLISLVSVAQINKPSNPFLSEERNTPVKQQSETPNTFQSTSYQISEFEQGFYDGYEEGWRSVKGKYARSPRPPRAPLPNSTQKEYKHGYIKGYKVGEGDAIKRSY